MAASATSLVITSTGPRSVAFAEANSSEMRSNEGNWLVCVHSSDQSATPPLVAQNSTPKRETLLASTSEYGRVVELVSNRSGACVITSSTPPVEPGCVKKLTRRTTVSLP